MPLADSNGFVNVLSRHTTTAVTINEMEGRLVDDVRQYLVRTFQITVWSTLRRCSVRRRRRQRPQQVLRGLRSHVTPRHRTFTTSWCHPASRAFIDAVIPRRVHWRCGMSVQVKLAPPEYPYLHNDIHLRTGPDGWPGNPIQKRLGVGYGPSPQPQPLGVISARQCVSAGACRGRVQAGTRLGARRSRRMRTPTC